MIEVSRIDWSKMNGLIPAVIQDDRTGRVLMLGYMNRDALDQTFASGLVTFFSRSKQRLWTKGETSGNTLRLVEVHVDCDGDSLLVRARPDGPACHLGTATCFGDDAWTQASFLSALERIIDQRASAEPQYSYTARLTAEGVRRIAQKVGEEAVEVSLAALAGDRGELIAETADLLFHLLLLLKAGGTGLDDVLGELRRRHAERSATVSS